MVLQCIGYFPEYREVIETPRGINWSQWALVEKREGRPGGGACPPCPNPNWTRGGAAPPSFLLSSSSFPPSPTRNRKEEGNPTWTGES